MASAAPAPPSPACYPEAAVAAALEEARAKREPLAAPEARPRTGAYDRGISKL